MTPENEIALRKKQKEIEELRKWFADLNQTINANYKNVRLNEIENQLERLPLLIDLAISETY